MPITTLLHPDNPSIRLTGSIDMPLAYELTDEINLLHDYYQFRTITLQIDSPGGEADALHFIVQSLAPWRRGEGRVLKTVGLNEICSAAAMLLSLGTLGHRSARAHSRLLYHSVRTVFSSDSAVTHAQLKLTGRRLEQWDDKLFDLISEHTRPLRPANGTASFKRRLKRLFEQERFITPKEACEMHLIDHVQ